MKFYPLVLVAAFSATLAVEAAAQEPTPRSDTTVTSTRRIPVQKVEESRGEIAPDSAAMADSLARARQDSIDAANRARQDSIDAANRARQDSIAAAERARQEELARIERARQDSIAAAERARLAEEERFRAGRFNGWYFNLGGGASVPMGDFDDLYGTGWNVTGSVGWHPTQSALGIRFDVTYDRLNGEAFAAPGGPTVNLSDAAIWAGLGEVTLRIPRALGLNPYVVAGGGIYRFSDYGSDGATSIYGNGNSESSTEWGWNAGGGLRFGWGFTSLFVEARYLSVGTPGDRAEWVPINLGITFR
ncbi:MAG: hypothetical protein ACT4PJ_11860 [Gemmatimonadaceae bacterium]